ncbi:MAG: type II toxin-antitoxin system RelE/ParE family toxin [Terriglobia bacterium]
MEWLVKYTDGFEGWWNFLSEAEQEDVNAKVILLQRYGPALRRPPSDVIASSRHSHMKELIIQHAGRPYRVLYAFDPRRTAILLLGGDKTGDDRWYEKFVPIADRLYDEHLAALEKEA